jgi:hypothetical protein
LVFQSQNCLLEREGFELVFRALGRGLLVGTLSHLNEAVDEGNAHRLDRPAEGLMGDPVELSEVLPQAGVKHVLDTVVSPAGNEFGDERPPISVFSVELHQKLFLLMFPGQFVDSIFKVVVVPFPALFSIPANESILNVHNV